MAKLKSAFIFISGLFLASCLSASASDRDGVPQPLLKKRRIDTIFTPPMDVKEECQIDNNGFVFYGKEVPEEVVLNIFMALPITDLGRASQVCRGWYALCEDPQLWKAMRLAIHGDYPEHEATRENAKLHWLRVHVNTLSDLEKIDFLVNKYQLNKGHPFIGYQGFYPSPYEEDLFTIYEIMDEKIAQGNQRALEDKLRREARYHNSIIHSQQGYPQGHLVNANNVHQPPHFNAARLLNCLIEQGNNWAITWQAQGLKNCWFGYRQDPVAAKRWDNYFIEQGSHEAILEEINRLLKEKDMEYMQSLQSAKEFIDELAEQGHEDAIKLKIEGLNNGWHGYEEDPIAAIAWLERLVEQGHEGAIQIPYENRTINYNFREAIDYLNSLAKESLKVPIYTHYHRLEEPDGPKDDIIKLILYLAKQGHEDADYWRECIWDKYVVYLEASVGFLDCLAKQGNETAIEFKIAGLACGEYGYKEDREAAVAFNESLVEDGNEAAIERKVKSLAGYDYEPHHNGYSVDADAAIAFNESLIQQGNKEALKRKIMAFGGDFNGLYIYGYKEDPKAAVALNEILIKEGDEWAIERKVEGLAGGENGYEEDQEAAVAFNDNLVEYGNEAAIKRKIGGLYQGPSHGSNYGYKKNLPLLKSWLEEEEWKGRRWACYLKAQGLKYGLLGFDQDREAAIKYIIDNGIPY